MKIHMYWQYYLFNIFHVVYSRGGALPDADAASEELGEAQRWRGASWYRHRKRSVWR